MTAVESHTIPAVGQRAPDFTLPSTSDEKVTLSSLRGKPVLIAPFPDFRRDVSRLSGVLLDDRYYSQRAYFLLGADGVLRWVHVESNPDHKREEAELLDAIDRMV